MAERKIKVLITNDDGIHSPGIFAIASELHLSGRYEVVMSSPSVNNSAQSHSITIHKLVTAERVAVQELDVPAWKISGTPADCVRVILRSKGIIDFEPDLVVSGINDGSNTGYNIHYSGTVGAAVEANMVGVPSVAMSMRLPSGDNIKHFPLCAEVGLSIIDNLVKHSGFPEQFRKVCINVNFPCVPKTELKGIKLVRQGCSSYEENYILEEKRSTDSKKVFRLEGKMVNRDSSIEFDTAALYENYVTIEALGLLYRSEAADQVQEHLNEWCMEGPIDTSE